MLFEHSSDIHDNDFFNSCKSLSHFFSCLSFQSCHYAGILDAKSVNHFFSAYALSTAKVIPYFFNLKAAFFFASMVHLVSPPFASFFRTARYVSFTFLYLSQDFERTLLRLYNTRSNFPPLVSPIIIT